MSHIHAVLFDKDIWNLSESMKWLILHNIHPIKEPRETLHFYRYRIIDPSIFRYFITKKLDGGIELVIGFY